MMLSPESNKTLKFLAIFLSASFIIFLIGVALAIYFIFLLPMNKEKTYGTVKNVTNNSTTIIYSAKGKTYNKKQKPFNSFISSFRYLSLIGPGIGIIFMGVSGILCMVFYKKEYNV